MQADDEKLLTRAEVEARFGYPTKRYLELAAVKGNGPPYLKIGRNVRYRVGELKTWLEAKKVESTSQYA